MPALIGTRRSLLLNPRPPDALAGIPFALRLQTHTGNSVPISLYQDVNCTIPATLEGESIAAWRDELGTSGLKVSQATEASQSMLALTDGPPEAFFDGVDDFSLFSAGISGSTSFLIVAAINPFGGTNRPLLDNADPDRLLIYPYSSGGAGQVGWYDGAFQDIAAGTLGWQVLTWEFNAGATSGTVYRNGVSLGSATYFPRSPNDGISLCSLYPAAVNCLDASIIGLWVCTDLSKRTIIENYAATLIP